MSKTITSFDRATCRNFSNELEVLLQKFAEERGLVLKRAGGRFSDLEYTPKFSFQVASEDGEGGSAAEQDTWTRYCKIMGCELEWFGKSFKYNNSILTIVGLNTRAKKDFVKIVNQNGRRLKCSPDFIRAFMK